MSGDSPVEKATASTPWDAYDSVEHVEANIENVRFVPRSSVNTDVSEIEINSGAVLVSKCTLDYANQILFNLMGNPVNDREDL